MLENIKKRLDNSEILELYNGVNLASMSKGQLSKRYIFVFNSKPLFGVKTFKIFLKRVNDKIIKHSLLEYN